MIDTPWMTADECWQYMRFPNIKTFYRWLDTHPMFPRGRRGRLLVFDRRLVDAYLAGDIRQRRSA